MTLQEQYDEMQIQHEVRVEALENDNAKMMRAVKRLRSILADAENIIAYQYLPNENILTRIRKELKGKKHEGICPIHVYK